MSLWEDYLNNDRLAIDKWVHYFPAYERHFAPWRNRSVTFIEIGVFQGGSLSMWQKYFGPLARIIGVDINPDCKRFEAPGIQVRIGDQSDHGFLQSLIDEFGIPDVVLDDGSHQMHHINATFDFLYPRMGKNAVYMVEDLHTAYWQEYGGGVDRPDTFVNRTKLFVDMMHADHTRGAIGPNIMSRETQSICFYDSIICLEKGDMWRKEGQISGNLIR